MNDKILFEKSVAAGLGGFLGALFVKSMNRSAGTTTKAIGFAVGGVLVLVLRDKIAGGKDKSILKK